MSLYTIYKNMCGIYCIENTINHHKYIGSSVNIGARLQTHLRSLNSGTHFNSHLQNAVLLYSIDNFTFYVIKLCEKDKLAYYEQYYIAEFEAEYNVDKEIVRHSHPKEIVDKIASKNRGKKRTEATKKILSEIAKSRRTNPMYGIHRYGKDSPMFGKHHSDEAKLKISKSKLGNSGGMKITAVKDNYSAEFKSVLDAARVLDIPRQAIYECLNGKRRSYKQYKFISNGE